MLRFVLSIACLVLPAALYPLSAQEQAPPQSPPQSSQQSRDFLVLSGQIDTSFDGISTQGITVTVNGLPTRLAQNGQFSAQVPLAPYYRIVAQGEGIYPAIQTFGILELYGEDCDCLQVPTFDVVARKEGRVSLFFAGDTMAGRRYVDPVWRERQLIDLADPLPDMRALLEPMKPYIESADLASANLEVVLSDSDFANAAPKSIVFYAHPALAQALSDAGFDHVSLGNNHSYDYLDAGLETTINGVEAAGLAWSGAGFDEEQALAASRLSVGDQDICLLGYVGWRGRVEPNQVAEANKGGAAYGSNANIRSSVSREAQRDCAVVAQYHGSPEYVDMPSSSSERRMKIAVDAGAALVASHHPHVVQGLELYNGSLIAYSTGNFLFDQYFLETHPSFALRAWLDNGEFVRAEVIPLRVLEYRPVPAVGFMRKAVLDRVTRLSASHETRIDRDGGHGVILADARSSNIAEVAVHPAGHDLLRGGDFESARFGTAQDRSLKVRGGEDMLVFDGPRGHYLRITRDADESDVAVMPATFLRVVPGKRITISGRVRANGPVEVAADYQRRPEGASRFRSLRNEPHIEGARVAIAAPGEWSEFELTFNLPDTDRPFRPSVRIIGSAGGAGSVVELDDLTFRAVPGS